MTGTERRAGGDVSVSAAELFDGLGLAYEEAFSRLPAQWEAVDWLAGRLPSGARVLDVGSGTGRPVAERLARPMVGTEDGPFILYRRSRFVGWLGDQLQKNTPYDQVAFFFSEVFGTKIGLLGDLDGGHDELIMRGAFEAGSLIGFYLQDDRLVAALIVGQPPEVQEELNGLLRRRARLADRSLLGDADSPPGAAFDLA